MTIERQGFVGIGEFDQPTADSLAQLIAMRIDQKNLVPGDTDGWSCYYDLQQIGDKTLYQGCASLGENLIRLQEIDAETREAIRARNWRYMISNDEILVEEILEDDLHTETGITVVEQRFNYPLQETDILSTDYLRRIVFFPTIEGGGKVDIKEIDIIVKKVNAVTERNQSGLPNLMQNMYLEMKRFNWN